MVTITWTLKADFDGVGTYDFDLTPYVDMPGMDLRVSRGIGRDGKPQTSKLGFRLSNRDGIFTPENTASALYGKVVPGVPVRLTATYATVDYSITTGYAMSWKVNFQAGISSTVDVECDDIFWFLKNGDPVNVTVSAARDTDAALVAICDALGLVAGDRNFDDGVQDLPLHFAVFQNPLEAMQAVAASEMGGLLYPAADGRIRFESRASRLGTTVDATWGDGTLIQPVAEEYNLNPLEFFTSVTARSTVFRQGQADIEIFRFSRSMDTRPNPDSISLAAGEVYERDFDTQAAVVAITAPVAQTDYQANDAIDGSGTDRTSLLDVTVTDHGAGRFTLKMVNTHSGTVYVTRFRLRGQPVEFYADRAQVQFSLSVPGLKAGLPLQFDVPFAGDTGGKLRDYAYQEQRVGRYPWPVLRLPFKAVLADQIGAMLAADLGHLIAYASAQDDYQSAQVDDWWYIEALEYRVPAGWAGEVFECTVTLIPSYVYRNLDAIGFDVFDRDNATGDLGTSTQGKAWANDTGFDIVSAKARANTDTLSIPDLTLGVNDQIWEVQLADIGTGDEVGLNLRKTDANNYLRAYVDKGSNEVILEEVVAGVATELASPAFTVGSAHEMRVMVQDTRVRVWVDRLRYIDATTSITTGTKGGLFARNASGTTTFANPYGEGL